MSVLEEFFPLKRHTIVPGAGRMERLMQAPLGRTALRIPCVLIVGTNGKGTVSLMLEHLLRMAGLGLGVYTSPHFVDPLERIRVRGASVDADMAKWARDQVIPWVEAFLPDATFFEITTAIALLCFQAHRVDFGIIEAGLGGRLDSTNALAPLVTVLTSVGLDHTDRLGPTYRSIAFEKAMASRRNRSLITGYLGSEAWTGVHEALERTGALLKPTVPPEVTAQDSSGGRDPLSPKQRNARTAIAVIQDLAERMTWDGSTTPLHPFREAIATIVRPAAHDTLLATLVDLPLPGRFDVRQWHGRTLILDNAHNAAATTALLKQYRESRFAKSSKGFVLVFGALVEKNFEESFRLLAEQSLGGAIVLFDHDQGLQESDAARLAEGAQAKALSQEHVHSAPFEILRLQDLRAWLKRQNPEPEAPVLITGSFALVGQVMKELGIAPT